MTSPTCPLCNSIATLFCEKPKHLFYKCNTCDGIFRPKDTFLTAEKEKEHYEKHNNDVFDERYQAFVSPIVNAVLHDFTAEAKGLDFGSGTGPVIAKMLTDKDYQVQNYDLFFANEPSLLKEKYDYVSCCEVMEHFHHPYQEFELLKSLLLPKGKLFCKTEVYNNQTPFENWYYKDDFTHVFIYQPKTLEWIQKNLRFSKVSVYDKIIVFEN
ncbi:class I SAM-dependent methyltransferase [Flavobacterium cheniae]|uniref:Methyltransferase family protein n=1 Tax=Flavobacterium cheniae TaxID=295428 RepID=A0A562KD20_9FLAO|nr:class I SAM-dependent methyltransferase [Flavobacterium cheniae]TDR25324.1 methyltransferase family protein [Flavobacterium cheniae]TWH93113.1 methyltransferase family protein [Flavobacterium cheniae]